MRTEKKRNLVATGYRVHGDRFLPLVRRLFTSYGSAQNLLGVIRCLPPLGGTDDPDVPRAGEWDAWAELEKLAR